ncbi:Fic/DOC family protein [Mycolicibacterium stellerae]|uniref:Fic/DOC family protein n=1 Tax=Mycolicibacterium stellerae TaxID=2358193 RepID=UPI000F0BB035|nr:Fic family protein [Mycolicibacterium stellerae]
MPANDRLPQRLRHCVDQTIAAEALEGWRPDAAHLDALVALVNDDVTFGDYLSAYRSRHLVQSAPETAPRPYRRRTPYLIPGTTLLRNNFGAATHRELADLEFVSTAGRMVRWHRRLADGDIGVDDLDVRAIHRALFADVYEWAGDFRVTELRLGDDVFARRSSVQRRTRQVEATARALVATDPSHHDDALASQLARLYADYNYAHPFREGNGRTGMVMLHIVTTLRGRLLDLATITREEWCAASSESMPPRRGGSTDHRPFIPLFVRALV